MENKVYNEQTLEYEEQPIDDFKAVTIVRGYVLYAKSDNGELYDFFYPSLQNRITVNEAVSLLPNNHKLLTTERQTRKYSIPMKQLDTYGILIEKK